MQKKLIALAVAAVVTAPAFAQSNVTVYGRIDMGYTYSSDHTTAGVESRSGIDSGKLQPSFIGFKGTEDLGNGLKVGFDFQTRLNIDTNEQLDTFTNPSTGSRNDSRRDAFLFVSGGFGTVAAGRLTTPQNAFLGSLDPFLDSAIVGFSTTPGYTQGAEGLGANVTRLDNTVAYISPNFSGLTVTAAYTASAAGDEQANDDADIEIWAINPVYTNGPLTVGLNYHKAELKAANEEETVWDLGGAYDFGVVKLSAAYGQDKTDFVGGSEKVKQWFVAGSIPVSAAGKVIATYGSQEIDNVNNSDVTKWGIGYHHDLSKRTMVYAQYGDFDIEANSVTGAGYEQRFGLGIKHLF